MAQEQIITARVDTSQGVNSLKSLQDNVKKYQNDLKNAVRGTVEYNKAIHSLANAQNELKSAQQEVTAQTQGLTSSFSAVTGTLSTVVGGFTAFQGVLALTGSSGDALEKTFVKLQAAIALTQGITAFTSGIKAARIALAAFNKTLLANPYLAVGAAVLALVAGFVKLANYLSDQKSGVDQLNKSYEDEKNTLIELNKERDHEINKLKAAGASTKEIIEQKRKNKQADIDNLKTAIATTEAEIKVNERGFKLWFNVQKKRAKAQREINKERKAELDKLLQELQDIENAAEIDQIQTDTKNESDAEKRRKEAAEKAATEADKRAKEQLDAEQKLIEERGKFSDLVYKLEQEQAAKSLKTRKELIAFREQELEKVKEEYNFQKGVADNINNFDDVRAEALQKQQVILQERYKLEQEIATLNEEEAQAENERREKELEFQLKLTELIEKPEEKQKRLQSEVEELKVLAELTVGSYEDRVEAVKKYQDAAKELAATNKQIAAAEKKEQADKLKITQQALSSAADLLGENTVAGKIAAVAAATINAYQAGALALASYPPPFSYVALATTIATGLANVKNILAVKTPAGTNDTSSSSALPALPTMPELNMPIQETHNNMNAQDEDFFTQNNRVYVTEYDISRTQGRVNVAESEASF